MTSFSNTAPPTKCPIDKVPYDVIREIFNFCLQNPPHIEHQTNNKVAPMLLCHICSSWRTITLESPFLWARLKYYLTVVQANLEFPWTVPKKEIEFLRWWKSKQGSMAPFLSLYVRFEQHSDGMQEYMSQQDALGFILPYITSAQYLAMDGFYWKQIQDHIESGYSVACPNLHTLLEFCGCYNGDHETGYSSHPGLPLMNVFTHHSPPMLRRLSISQHRMSDINAIPNNWSMLTHLMLPQINLSASVWFTLIRASVNLQWGYFLIGSLFDIADSAEPTKRTIPEMSAIFVLLHARGNVEFPLSFLFKNLHLPALRTLSLMSNAGTWWDHRAVTEIGTVLNSAPNITTLILGPRLFGSDSRHYDPAILSSTNMEPVWSRATKLTHLQLEIHLPYNKSKAALEAALDQYIQSVFLSSNKWLALESPACPIHRITIIDFQGVGLTRITDFAASRAHELSERTPNVDFHITLKSPNQTAEEASREWAHIL